jgi:peptidoglycan hydrolase-like protein with peptidoglycan-binding domain
MKHSLFSVVLGIALVAGAAVANAQTYVYPLTSGVPLPSACVSFTAYQTFGSSDITTSGQVSELQVLLNREGYLSGVSGTYDNGTYGAVINYQRAHGIQITGTVGPITAAALSQDGCQGSYGNTGYGSQIL